MTTIYSKTLPYSAFSAGATNASVTVFTATKDCFIGPVWLWVNEDFAGGSVSSCNASVGDGSNATLYLTNTDVFTSCAADSFTAADLATLAKHADVNATAMVLWTPAARGADVKVKVTASHNTNTLNAGALTVIWGVTDI